MSDRAARDKWQGLTPLARNEWICWVTFFKKAETRMDHVERTVTELKEGKRRPCCWIGCIHRKDKAISPSIRGILKRRKDMTTSTEIVGIGRVTIHPGKLDDYKRLSKQCLEIVKTKDTGTLQYDLFINAEGTECVFIERYTNSQALIEHFANIGPELMQKILATGTFVGEILGNASPELEANMKDGPVRLFTPFISL